MAWKSGLSSRPRVRCLAPAAGVYPRALQPGRKIPTDKVLEPQDILPVGGEQLLPDLRRERRRLDEDPALYIPARPGREIPLEDRVLEDLVPGGQFFGRPVQGLVPRQTRGVVLDGHVRDERVVHLQELQDIPQHLQGFGPQILVEPDPKLVPTERVEVPLYLSVVESLPLVVPKGAPVVLDAPLLRPQGFGEVDDRLAPGPKTVQKVGVRPVRRVA